MIKRLIADIALFVFIILAPWQLTAALIFVLIILFPNYWEGVAASLVIDSLYSLPDQKIRAGFGVFALSALAVLRVSSFVKSKARIFN